MPEARPIQVGWPNQGLTTTEFATNRAAHARGGALNRLPIKLTLGKPESITVPPRVADASPKRGG